MRLKKSFFFIPPLPPHLPHFLPKLLPSPPAPPPSPPPPDRRPAQLGPVRAVPGVRGWYELAVAWAKQHVCTAAARCLVPPVAQQPGDTGSGPSQLPGGGWPRRHLVLSAPPKAGGERASLMSRKDSADGAPCEARGAHSECSEFLAGQNRGCWLYLFVFWWGGRGIGERRLRFKYLPCCQPKMSAGC